MALTTLPAPCWHLVERSGVEACGEWEDRHYPAADDKYALQHMEDQIRDDEDEGRDRGLHLAQTDYVCSELACDHCGYVYDEQGDGRAHLDAETLPTLVEGEWVQVDGKWFCASDECRREVERLNDDTGDD